MLGVRSAISSSAIAILNLQSKSTILPSLVPGRYECLQYFQYLRSYDKAIGNAIFLTVSRVLHNALMEAGE